MATRYPIAKMWQGILLVLIFGYLNLITESATICSSDILNQCFKSNDNISLSPNWNNAIPIFDNASMDWICRSYLRREECLLLHGQCTGGHSDAEAKENALKYLCNEGMEGYVDSRECYEGEVTLHKIRKCNATYNKQTGSVLHMEASIEVTRRKLCDYMLQFLDCLKATTAEQCGHTAGDVLYTFNYHLMSGVMNTLQCSTGGTLDPAGVWGITGGCAIALICIIIVILLCKRRIEKTHAGGYLKNNSRGHSVASTTQKISVGPAARTHETTYVGNSPKNGSRQLSKQKSSVVVQSETISEMSVISSNQKEINNKEKQEINEVVDRVSRNSSKSTPIHMQQET